MHVGTWIRNTDLMPGGNKDHLAFVHATELIFRHAKTGDENILFDIRDVLMYLLLQCNPSTGELHKIEHPVDKKVSTIRYNALMESLTRDIRDSIDNRKKMRPYHLLQLIDLIGNDASNKWMYGEIPALVCLASWLLERTVPRSIDVLTCRACRKFYCSHSYQRQTPEGEFITGVPGYLSWISGELDRICINYEKIADVSYEVSYLGCFSALIRACRMTETTDPLWDYLREELAWINEITRSKC